MDKHSYLAVLCHSLIKSNTPLLEGKWEFITSNARNRYYAPPRDGKNSFPLGCFEQHFGLSNFGTNIPTKMCADREELSESEIGPFFNAVMNAEVVSR